MGKRFSASEITQMGVQIEKNGRDFYTVLAKSSKKDEVKDVFQFLAKEEERHIKLFSEILSGFEKYEPSDAYPDEYFAYLKSLSDTYIFTKENTGREIAQSVEDDIEAIDLGIGFEKDSILFYMEMKNMVWKEGKKIVDQLIEEERSHLRKLSEIKMGFEMWDD
ncbi:MAG: ferritin-like domain-containing protein [bacterium]